jgi:hypothetical protein
MDAIEQAKASGVTEVQTFAGWTPLDMWRPYGNRPQDAKYVTFRFDGERRAFREESAPGIRPASADGLVLGVWPVR